MVNVGKRTIHGWYGYRGLFHKPLLQRSRTESNAISISWFMSRVLKLAVAEEEQED